MITFHKVLIFSTVLRVALIMYGDWQDSHMEVRYTDVDYLVFSDAAALVSSGESPFKRTTYRYSPLLAFLLVPNVIIHPSWGKYLFSASALLVNVFFVVSMKSLLIIFPSLAHGVMGHVFVEFSIALFGVLISWKRRMKLDLLVGYLIRTILKLRGVPDDKCLYSVMAWLFNPFTFTIGTRGNCEPIVCAAILWIITCIMKGKTHQAAIWYGLIVHFRIYPIIYALPIILLLDPTYIQSGQNPKLVKWSSHSGNATKNSDGTESRTLWTIVGSLFSSTRILFALISGSIFLTCTGIFYYLYRWEFLHEALLYHLTRTDPRHNFSIYFYHIYLHYQHELSIVEKLISFLPQFTLQLVLVFCFALDLPFCFLVQTVAFVAFNKVITAQYFVWFFCLLPLVLPWSKMKLKWQGFFCILGWMGTQLHWLMWAYLLEFKGRNVFLQLWIAGLLFLFANSIVLVAIIRCHRYTPIFERREVGRSEGHLKHK